MPGNYTVRLIADGKTYTQPLKVAMDPRVKTPLADLEQQFKLAKSIYDDQMSSTATLKEISVLREQLKARSGQPIVGQAGPSLESKLDAIAGPEHRGGFARGPMGPPTLTSARMQLARLLHSIENADAAPTPAQQDAVQLVSKPLPGLIEQWQKLKQTDLHSLNEQLQRNHLAIIDVDKEKLNANAEDPIEMGDED